MDVARASLMFAATILSMPPGTTLVRAESPAEEILTGRVKPGAILGLGPGWRQEYDAYMPATVDTAAIEGALRGTTLDVFFGSWCGDSRTGVPRLLKILDAAPRHRIKVRYIGVDRSKTEPAKLLRGIGLDLVPTYILRVHGREIGRIVENPETTLEHDLANLVLRAVAPAP